MTENITILSFCNTVGGWSVGYSEIIANVEHCSKVLHDEASEIRSIVTAKVEAGTISTEDSE